MRLATLVFIFSSSATLAQAATYQFKAELRSFSDGAISSYVDTLALQTTITGTLTIGTSSVFLGTDGKSASYSDDPQISIDGFTLPTLNNRVNDPKTTVINDRTFFTSGGTYGDYIFSQSGGNISTFTGQADGFGFFFLDEDAVALSSVSLPATLDFSLFERREINFFSATIVDGKRTGVEDFAVYDITVSSVPLPAGGWLLLSGVFASAAMLRRRKKTRDPYI